MSIAPSLPAAPLHTALHVQTLKLTKRFGSFTALDQATLDIRPGTVHALLGENGAGKSTLVKCLAGYHQAEEGDILLDGREAVLPAPSAARAAGIGMVYQHFTAVPGMTVAENLLLARGELPFTVPWGLVRRELSEFMERMPFRLPLDVRADDLAAGERQKLEILKQLYLQPRLLILDEPSSVLTPDEADEVLGLLGERAHQGSTTIVLITHKFREVLGFADDVTVLRHGAVKWQGEVKPDIQETLAQAMMGEARAVQLTQRKPYTPGGKVLEVQSLSALNDRARPALTDLSFHVSAGEVVGVAGVAGNGQRELMQCLTGVRRDFQGEVRVRGEAFHATRDQYHRLKVRSLPEEPLRNACVASLSVTDNIALRGFDQAPLSAGGWIRKPQARALAERLIGAFRVKTRSALNPIRDLSGGNVQRAVLARELHEPADVLLVHNPVFGLDFAATAEIHERIAAMRDQGCAVLWISEDTDELLANADRILVISDGRIAWEGLASEADRKTLGHAMAGAMHTEAAHA
jgi:simple sugar transport system ATP-binding protein